MSTKTKTVKIQLNWDWLQPYDIDNIPGFSASELEKMPAGPASYVFENGRKISNMSYDDAFRVFKDLTTSKQSRILVGFVDSNERTEYFRRIAILSLEKAYAILQHVKEGPYDPAITGQGFKAYRLLNKLPEALRNPLEERLKREDPGYFHAVQSQREKIEAWGRGDGALPPLIQQVYKEVTGLKNPDPSSKPRQFISDPKEAIEVLQNQYMISKQIRHRYLQSFGAQPCLIVTFYDPSSQIGMVAHFDALTDVHNSLDKILQEMKEAGANKNTLEARVVGSRMTADELRWHIEDRLAEEKIFIVETSFDAEQAAITLDLQTGRIYDYKETQHHTPGEEAVAYLKTIRNVRFPRLANKHPESL